MTDPVVLWEDKYARDIDVIINMTADAVVILFSIGTGPSVPNRDWPEPPKVAPISAPLPCCSKTIETRNTQTIIWIIVSIVIICFVPLFQGNKLEIILLSENK
jgi:hypothetical protein